MELLDQIQKIHDSEKLLGLRFYREAVYFPMLPANSRLIAYADPFYFCTLDGYQNTIFAVAAKSGYGSDICPLAYDFREFLRLILACGSAAIAAKAGFCSREVFSLIRSDSSCAALKKLSMELSLSPVSDPYTYVQTVRQVIDCSGIRF